MVPRFVCFLLAGSLCLAQQIGNNKPGGSEETPTFRSSTQMVIETVTVTDRKGNPIRGLTAKDFAVTENGTPQTISSVDYQELAAPGSVPAMPRQRAEIKIYDRLTPTQITPEKTATTRYRNRRLLALYFDFTAMQEEDQLRALGAAKKFIETQMTDDDRLAILRYAGAGVEVLQDFTGDRERLLSIIQTLLVGENQTGFYESGTDASSPDTGAAFGQDDAEFNIFNSDRQLAALQTASQMLGRLNEKKSLLYFAGGLRLNGRDNLAQLHATVNAAVRAGVSLWPIDSRGLVAEAPLGDASQANPGGVAMYNGEAALATTTNLQLSQDTLYSLAGDTGGKAFLDSNDLTAGITRAANAIRSYYILGYNTTNTASDGNFRHIKIRLANGAAANLDYRQGYFASKEYQKFNAVDKERQLEDALLDENPITDLTMAIELDYFQLNRAEYFVPLIVKIPGSELTLAKHGGSERTVIDFIGEIKDEYGSTITNLRDRVDIKLSDETAAHLAKRPVQYDTGFTLLPGNYVLKFLARDNETGRIGTYETKFAIPNLTKEEKRVPISSVVLGSQRVALSNALYNAHKDKDKLELTNPLMQSGQKLIPSVTRVFHRGQQMFVYLQSYQSGATPERPVIAFVTLYQENNDVFESEARESDKGLPGTVRRIPFEFTIPLASVKPGRYLCQVTVLDPSDRRTNFWRAPIVIAP